MLTLKKPARANSARRCISRIGLKFMTKKISWVPSAPTDPKSFSDMDEESLWTFFSERPSIACRDELFNRYRKFADMGAKSYLRRMPYRSLLDPSDILSLAHCGLIDAIHSYDYKLGVSFSTWSYPRIFGSIIDGLRSVQDFSRIISKIRREILPLREYLEQKYSRKVTIDEIIDEFPHTKIGKFPLETFRGNPLIEASVFNQSDESSDCNSDSFQKMELWLISQRGCKNASPSAKMERQDIINKVMKVLDKDNDEKTIVYLYYFMGMIYPTISKITKLSNTDISIKKNNAIMRLKEEVKNNEEFCEMLQGVI